MDDLKKLKAYLEGMQTASRQKNNEEVWELLDKILCHIDDIIGEKRAEIHNIIIEKMDIQDDKMPVTEKNTELNETLKSLCKIHVTLMDKIEGYGKVIPIVCYFYLDETIFYYYLKNKMGIEYEKLDEMSVFCFFGNLQNIMKLSKNLINKLSKRC